MLNKTVSRIEGSQPVLIDLITANTQGQDLQTDIVCDFLYFSHQEFEVPTSTIFGIYFELMDEKNLWVRIPKIINHVTYLIISYIYFFDHLRSYGQEMVSLLPRQSIIRYSASLKLQMGLHTQGIFWHQF
jgi:hypothetical protein